MLGCRINTSPSFQLGIFLPNSIRNQRIVALHAFLVRERIPIIRGVGVPVRSGGGFFRDVEYGRDGGCEDEAFEGGVLVGGLEDGECSGDGGFD